MNIIFSSAIKGAGDTHNIMCLVVTLSIGILVISAYIVLEVLYWGIYAGWAIASIYIAALGLAFFKRFLSGKWKSMRVIDLSARTRRKLFYKKSLQIFKNQTK